MLNRDIDNKPPKENRLVNNGVAEDHSEGAQAVLRYELETFVGDGQYEKGLETILDKFLLNLDARTEPPGVWISGFYGSGKSHLATGTPEQLQDALDDCDLDHWAARTQALPSRFEAARHAAVQLLKPNVVHVSLPKRTLNDEAELQSWLEEVAALLRRKIQQGPVAL